MACDLNTLLTQLCDSGIGKVTDPIKLQQIIAQLACEGASGGPTVAFGDITGNVGAQANLQAAIDEAKGYVLPLFNAVNINPADGATYFVGSGFNTLAQSVSFVNSSVEIPKSGVIRRLFVKAKIAGTLGSGQLVQHFVSINNLVDAGQVDFAYSSFNAQFVNAAVNQSVLAGDMVALKIVTPAWAPNPTQVSYYASLFIE
jgi:hypothetical protein